MLTVINMKCVFGLATLVSLVLSLPQTTRPPTTTVPHPPHGACVVDGKLYHNGETISRDPENCYFSRCSGGSVEYGDDRCFLMGQPHCNGQLVDIPGQCCHECREFTPTTTSTTTTSPSVPPGACIVNGHVYMNGETVFADPNKCHDLVCVQGTIVHLDNPCLTEPCSGIVEHVHGQCCPVCHFLTSTLDGPLPPVGK